MPVGESSRFGKIAPTHGLFHYQIYIANTTVILGCAKALFSQLFIAIPYILSISPQGNSLLESQCLYFSKTALLVRNIFDFQSEM